MGEKIDKLCMYFKTSERAFVCINPEEVEPEPAE